MEWDELCPDDLCRRDHLYHRADLYMEWCYGHGSIRRSRIVEHEIRGLRYQ